MKQKIFKTIKIIALLFGVTLLASLIHKLGWQTVVNKVWEFGWYFWGTVAISLLALFLHSIGWYESLSQANSRPTLWNVCMGKLGGEAINAITPANFVGGDPFRIYFLRKHISITEGTASVVIDRTLYTMSSIVMITIGIFAVFAYIPVIPIQVKLAMPGFVILASALLTFICVHQHKGLFSLIINILKKLKIKKNFSEKTLERLANLDGRISDFYTNNKRGFVIALILHIIGRHLAIVEIYYIGKIITPDFTLFAAIFLGAMSTIVNFAFTFVPGAVGIMEGAYGGVSYLLGIDASAGVAIQLIRRIRQIVITIMGFIVIAIYEKKGSKPTTTNKRIRNIS